MTLIDSRCFFIDERKAKIVVIKQDAQVAWNAASGIVIFLLRSISEIAQVNLQIGWSVHGCFRRLAAVPGLRRVRRCEESRNGKAAPTKQSKRGQGTHFALPRERAWVRNRDRAFSELSARVERARAPLACLMTA